MTGPGEGARDLCCDMHNEHCEPPGDLCCEDCSEFHHGMHVCVSHLGVGFPGVIKSGHHDGSRCVLLTTPSSAAHNAGEARTA